MSRARSSLSPSHRRGEGRGEGRHATRSAHAAAPHPNPLPTPKSWGEGNRAATAGRAMRLSRAERSLLVDWWFTVDRALLAAVLVIVGAGLLLSLAASPSIALRRGLPTFYFVERHVVFALASVALLLAVSLLSPAGVRRLALAVLLASLAMMALVVLVGAEINGARRWLHVGGYSLQPSEFAKPAFVVLSAWLLAEGERRPDMPAMPMAVSLYLAARRPARAAARRRPGAAGEPGVGCAVPAGRPAAALVLRARGSARRRAARRLHEPRLRALAHRPLPAPHRRRQLPDRPGAALLHRGRLLRQGPRRGHHQDRAARRPHRLHLRGDRRGVRRARLPGDPGPVRAGGGAGVLAPCGPVGEASPRSPRPG